MRRVSRLGGAALAVLIVVFAVAAEAQTTDATPLELLLIDTWVDGEVAAARGVDVEAHAARVAQHRAALLSALGRGATVDLPAVRAEVRARLSEVEARLAEVGRTCGPIPDTTPARARRDALQELLEALDRGPFTADR
jgi:hypothetical protein